MYTKIFLHLLIFASIIKNVAAQHQHLNDEFNSPCTITDWLNITNVEGWTTPLGLPAEHLEEHDISVTYPGELFMMPYTSSWYGDWRGTLIFKELVGDFIFTAQITATNRSSQALPPSSNYSLAGMMVRTPTDVYNPPGDTTGIQNYVFASIGRATSNNQFELEIKTTSNSSSDLVIDPIGPGNNSIYMRIIRVNSTVIVISSFDNINWDFRYRYNRNDFPDTMQLGFVTYTDWSNVQSVGFASQNVNILNDTYNTNNGTSYNWNPDLIGRFGFARFEEVEIPPELIGVDLYNSATPSQIISAFGHPSAPKYNTGNKIWIGAVDSDWMKTENWIDGAVPIAGEEIIIPNCECTEVNMPTLPTGTPTFASFRIEKGGSLHIPANAQLNVDLMNEGSEFIVEGSISNTGLIQILNTTDREVKIIDHLTNNPGSQLRIEE